MQKTPKFSCDKAHIHVVNQDLNHITLHISAQKHSLWT